MKVSYHWLKEYVDVTDSPAVLAEKLTARGLKVEVVEARNPGVSGVIAGRVVSIERHPNADTLFVCQVETGSGRLQVVTGAPNVRAGDLVPFAVPGSRLPGKEMGIAAFRGVESHGMLCSPEELGINEGGDGILILPPDPAVVPGTDAAELLGLNDTVIELDLTTNYAAHCQSMIGVALEVAAITGGEVRWPSALVAGDAGLDPAEPSDTERIVSVRIDDPDLCARYTARVIEGIRIGPSPAWLQARLRAAGMRPINNVVDATNYVMLELGQPLHAFDFLKVGERQIVVRRARDGETMVTLDKQERRLDADTLVIADAVVPVALAGVMGGYDSEVTEETETILLESAIFESINNRRTSRRLGLPSEASSRFTKGVDPSGVIYAANRAAALIAELAGGRVLPGAADAYPRPYVPKVIPFRLARVNGHSGLSLPAEAITAHLERLSIRVLRPSDLVADLAAGAPEEGAEKGDDLPGRPVWTAIHQVSPVPSNPDSYDGWAQAAWQELERAGAQLSAWGAGEGEARVAVVPTRRLDLAEEIDLVEEVARSEGFDRIPATLPRGPAVRGGRSRLQELALAIKQTMVAAGLDEVVTYSLLHPRAYDKLRLPPDHPARSFLRLGNPLNEERSTLRTTLLPGLLDVLQHNVNRGIRDLGMFEISAVYRPVPGSTLPDEPQWLGMALMGVQHAKAWNRHETVADFYTAKGILAAVLDALNIRGWSVKRANDPVGHPGRTAHLVKGELQLGTFGELHPKVAEAWDLPGRVIYALLPLAALAEAAADLRPYRPVPRYPAAARDVSFVIAQQVAAGTIEEAIRRAGGDLVEEVRLFDLYQGEKIRAGYRSLAYAITYRSAERTLTDVDVEAVHGKVRRALGELGAELRS
jgi:phenylalanyl-tRNA synthetase beta chain